LTGQVLSNSQQTNLFNISGILEERILEERKLFNINLSNEQQALLFSSANVLCKLIWLT
jgi:hypothetical protein